MMKHTSRTPAGLALVALLMLGTVTSVSAAEGPAWSEIPVRCKPRARDPVTHVGDDWTASPGPGASASMALIYWNRGPSAETGPDLTVGHLNLAPGNGYPFHRHPHAEIIYTTKGKGAVTLWRIGDDKPSDWPMLPNTTLWLPPGTVHDIRNDGAEDFQMMVFVPTTLVMEVMPEGMPTEGPYNKWEDFSSVKVPVFLYQDCPEGLKEESGKDELQAQARCGTQTVTD